MSYANFIPQIWVARLLNKLDKVLVFAQSQIVNRDYEGEIAQMGDTVRINSIGRVTIRDYTKGTDITAPEELTSAQQTLVIDRGKYYNFLVSDVDKVQANAALLDLAMQDAAYGLADEVDSFIAGLYTQAASANLYGSDGSPKTFSAATDAYTYLVQLGQLLSEANVPKEGRWVVVPPFFTALLQKDTNFIHSTALGDAILRNGQIGRAAGFDVMESNNVHSATTTYHIMAGTNRAISYASQVTETEAYRPEKRFEDAVKGLHIYGGKVVYPEALAVLTCTKPS